MRNRMEIAEKIARLRWDAKLTLREVAAACGCSEQYIWQIENNYRKPSARITMALTELFDYDLESMRLEVNNV